MRFLLREAKHDYAAARLTAGKCKTLKHFPSLLLDETHAIPGLFLWWSVDGGCLIPHEAPHNFLLPAAERLDRARPGALVPEPVVTAAWLNRVAAVDPDRSHSVAGGCLGA
jgi:hypothetical protein